MAGNRLSILGVGLLGGSVGLAVAKRLSGWEIVGYAHRQETRVAALQRGAVHAIAETAKHAVRDADLVILATPVGLFESLLKEIGPALKPGAIVTDVGSTKRSIVRLAEQILPSSVHFVGSHPMAGSEKRGVDYATNDLFDGALCLITPTPKTTPHALEVVKSFWKLLGMRIKDLSPEDHDRLLAAASHLPHAVAAALVSFQPEAALPLAGKGFRDATRIAGGDGGLWRDIFVDNQDNLTTAIDGFIRQLQLVSDMLKSGQNDQIKMWLDLAAMKRAAMKPGAI